MKFILGFFRVIISFVLIIALFVGVFVYGLVKPIAVSLSPDKLNEVIGETIDGTVEAIIENLDDNEEFKAQVDAFALEKNLPFTAEQATEVLKQPDVQELVSDYLSSVVLHSIDENNPVEYPEKQELKDVVVKNKEVIIPVIAGSDAQLPSDEDIDQYIEANYDNICEMLKDYAETVIGEVN